MHDTVTLLQRVCACERADIRPYSVYMKVEPGWCQKTIVHYVDVRMSRATEVSAGFHQLWLDPPEATLRCNSGFTAKGADNDLQWDTNDLKWFFK